MSIMGISVKKWLSLFFVWFIGVGTLAAASPRRVDNIGTDGYFAPWRLLDVPHDWSIEQVYDKDVPGHRANAHLPAGIGWYKKEIEWSDDWEDKLVFVDFDGVYMKSTVWINGRQIGYRPNGYLSLFYELTPHLKKGKNVLTVKVDNSLQPSARWYTGSGIYRHVNLAVRARAISRSRSRTGFRRPTRGSPR